jgi:exodeoxyribonuclease VII small subunit
MEKITYTQAVERLEEIMNSIQGGGMDVDKLAVALKEASALVQFCRGKLYEVDEEVKQLLDNMDDDSFCS